MHVEDPPKEMIGYSPQSYSILMIRLWILRVMGLFLLGGAMYIVLFLGIENGGDVFMASATAFAGTFALVITEVYEKNSRRSAHRVRVYENGMELYTLPYEKLLGYKEFIPKGSVVKLEILRYPEEGILNGKAIVWRDAPIEIVVHTAEGRRRRTGAKRPEQIRRLTDLMKSMWGTPVEDHGTGMGRAEPRR